jgi:hypothetical protein
MLIVKYIFFYLFTVIFPADQTWRGLSRRQAERLLYWGSSLWTWQHWIMKGILYIVFCTAALTLRRVLIMGNEYVVKAVYKREKDLDFVGVFQDT